jgi:hypothetical protein
MRIAACIGNGGQRIFIDNENKLMAVFTGGNYRMPDKYLQPYHILKHFIYPAAWVKRKGNWKMVASQGTSVSK